MENNKLIKAKDSILSRIFKKIRLLFFKNKKEQVVREDNEENKVDIRERLKVNVTIDDIYKKEELLKEIRKNPHLLRSFSIEQLKKIKEYIILNNYAKC